MEPDAIERVESQATDDREWELVDEELDRAADGHKGFCSTSRPCTCSRCACR